MFEHTGQATFLGYSTNSLMFFLLAAITMAFVLIAWSAHAEPPTSGDWYITEYTSITGSSVTLNGNLTITSPGRLVFTDVDLVMNGSSSRFLTITVETGGILELRDRDHNPQTTDDATIVHGPPDGTHYLWRCRPDSSLLISCSLVRDCGNPTLEGLMLETSDAIIENSTFEDNYYGICTNGSSPRIENTTFIDNDYFGLYEYQGMPFVQWCTFKHNLQTGVRVVSPEFAWFKNCSFEDHQVAGMNLSGGVFCIHDSRFSNNSEFAIDCNLRAKGIIAWTQIDGGLQTGILAGEGCSVSIYKCEVRGFGGRGIWIQKAPVGVDSTSVRDCRESIYIDGPSNVGPYIGNSILEQSVNDNVVVVNSRNVQFSNCTVMSSGRNGIYIKRPGYSTVFLLDCVITGCANAGVLVEQTSYCRLEDVEFVDIGNYALYCDNGAFADWDIYETSEIANKSIRMGGLLTAWKDLTLVNMTLIFGYTRTSEMGGISVTGCRLNILDHDNDILTMSDATTISPIDGLSWSGPPVRIDIEQHGLLVARNSRFTETILYTWASTLRVDGCEFNGTGGAVTVDFAGLGDKCWVANSTFTGCRAGVSVLTDDSAITVQGCLFSRCDISVEVQLGRLEMADCLMDSCGIGINGSGWVKVLGTEFSECKEGIVFHNGDLYLDHFSISGWRGSGLRLESVIACLSNVVIDGNGTAAMVADQSDIAIEHCRMKGGSISLSLKNSSTYILDTTLTGFSGRLIQVIGGGLRIEDSSVALTNGSMLSAQMGAAVEVYNTSLRVDAISATDTSTIDVYWQFRVCVLLATTGNPPPPPVQVVVKDLQHEKVLATVLDQDGRTPWTWARQLHATLEGSGFQTPHDIEIKIGDYDFSTNFELSSRSEHVVLLPVTLKPKIAYDAPIDEGREAIFDGSGSSSHPYDIKVWEWDFEFTGDFSKDTTGTSTRWTFLNNGTFEIALRITDSIGTFELTVISIIVRDTVPQARIVGNIPSWVYEDDFIGFEGAVISTVDPGVSQTWDFGDGKKVNGTHANHSWDKEGYYTVTFSVIDADGSLGSASVTLEVRNRPPIALASVDSVRVEKGSEVLLDGSGSNDTRSDIVNLHFEWDLGNGENLSGPQVSYRYLKAGNYTAILYVTDDEGAVGMTHLRVEVFNLPPRLGAIPDVTLKDADSPFDLILGALVSDPDDNPFNLTVIALSTTITAIEATAHWDPDKGWKVTLVPHAEGLMTVRIVVTVMDVDGSDAERAFNVTIQEERKGLSTQERELLGAVIALIVITGVGAVVIARTRREKE